MLCSYPPYPPLPPPPTNLTAPPSPPSPPMPPSPPPEPPLVRGQPLLCSVWESYDQVRVGHNRKK